MSKETSAIQLLEDARRILARCAEGHGPISVGGDHLINWPGCEICRWHNDVERMLTGKEPRHPGTGESLSDLKDRHLHAPVAP